MILSAAEAKRRVLREAKALPPERLRLGAQALGRVLASPLRAPQPSPRWTVSAMDGFALKSADFPDAYGWGLELVGKALAGAAPLSLPRGSAIKIMTGALLPSGADAVCPQELAREAAGRIFVALSAAVGKGDHVRHAGEELKRGAWVAKAGTRLNSRWIGFLNGLGISEALAYRRPRVSLLVSGNELRPAGSRLKSGQIHDSNGPMLEAALAELGLACKAQRLRDDPTALTAALKSALRSSDLVLLVGGVSVGEADYSKAVLTACGVRRIFWGVAQKPGKPLFFGRKGKTLVFGLPGNPSAAWVCFHEYVRLAFQALMGIAARPTRFASSAKEPRWDAKKTLFLKARLKGPRVEVLEGQQSHMLRSLAEANALAVVEPGKSGRWLEVHPL